jgi:hypothetical protein
VSLQCIESEICTVGLSVACVFQVFHNNENGKRKHGVLCVPVTIIAISVIYEVSLFISLPPFGLFLLSPPFLSKNINVKVLRLIILALVLYV